MDKTVSICIICGSPWGWNCDCIEVMEALADKENRTEEKEYSD